MENDGDKEAQKYYGWLDAGANGWDYGTGANQNPGKPFM